MASSVYGSSKWSFKQSALARIFAGHKFLFEDINLINPELTFDWEWIDRPNIAHYPGHSIRVYRAFAARSSAFVIGLHSTTLLPPRRIRRVRSLAISIILPITPRGKV